MGRTYRSTHASGVAAMCGTLDNRVSMATGAFVALLLVAGCSSDAPNGARSAQPSGVAASGAGTGAGTGTGTGTGTGGQAMLPAGQTASGSGTGGSPAGTNQAASPPSTPANTPANCLPTSGDQVGCD